VRGSSNIKLEDVYIMHLMFGEVGGAGAGLGLCRCGGRCGSGSRVQLHSYIVRISKCQQISMSTMYCSILVIINLILIHL
jgi:hypothetical protein